MGKFPYKEVQLHGTEFHIRIPINKYYTLVNIKRRQGNNLTTNNF